MMSAREALFSGVVPEEKVKVGGESVTVRGLTTAGRDVLEAAVRAGESFRPSLLRATCFVKNKPLFDESDDVGAIPSHLAEPLVNAAIRVSAMTVEEAEELEGN